MAGLKDIKRRIKSVKNTKKITYAMKLVSAAKLRKAQDAVKAAREYTDALEGLLGQLKIGGESTSHPLMEAREEVKNILLVVVGGSRGLCGGYNSNLNKAIDEALVNLSTGNENAYVSIFVLGKKPLEYVNAKDYPLFEGYKDLPENANDWPIADIYHQLESQFTSGEVDEVHLLYTKFRSAMSQDLTLEQILPLKQSALEAKTTETEAEESLVEAIFEPSAEAVFKAVIPRIIATKVRQAGLDAKASEHGSRMVAMDAATKNAGELSHKLTLTHNKLRQSAITAELLDIIGGAAAVD